jgi:hypothetical protein
MCLKTGRFSEKPEKPAGSITEKPAGFLENRPVFQYDFSLPRAGASLALGRPPRAGATLALGQYERRILKLYTALITLVTLVHLMAPKNPNDTLRMIPS